MLNFDSFPAQHSDIYNDMEKSFEHSSQNNLLKNLTNECHGDKDLEELLTELIETSQKYVEDICDIIELKSEADGRETAEEIAKKDEIRTILHNSIIDTVNPIYRRLNLLKRDTKFLEQYIGSNRNTYRILAIELIYDLIKQNLDKQRN